MKPVVGKITKVVLASEKEKRKDSACTWTEWGLGLKKKKKGKFWTCMENVWGRLVFGKWGCAGKDSIFGDEVGWFWRERAAYMGLRIFSAASPKNTSAHANQKSLSIDAPLSNISIPMKHPSRTGYDWDAAAAAPHPKVNHAHS